MNCSGHTDSVAWDGWPVAVGRCRLPVSKGLGGQPVSEGWGGQPVSESQSGQPGLMGQGDGWLSKLG